MVKLQNKKVATECTRLDEALATYDKTIAEHPYDIVAQHGRAEVLKALNRLAEALAKAEAPLTS